MKTGQIPVRLLAEVLAIVALTQAVVLLLLPRAAPDLSGLSFALFNAGLLALASAPLLYWRCMDAVRQAVGSKPGADVLAGAGGSSHRQQRRAALAMTGVAQVVGLALTATALHWMSARIDADAHTHFVRQIERVEAEIARRFQLPVYGMNGAKGVYAANQVVTRKQFRSYVESRNLPVEFPGISGFGFVQQVMRKDLDAFVAAERADDAPGFKVKTSGDAPDTYIIKFFDPLPTNHSGWGVDVGVEAERRATIRRAIDTGKPALTGKLSLVNSATLGPGFLYFVPVYRHGSDPVTVEQRRFALVGLIVVPIYASKLLAGIVDTVDKDLDFDLFAGDGDQAERLVFATGVQATAATASAASGGTPLFRMGKALDIGGTRLTLQARTTPSFESEIQRRSLTYVSFGGVVLSFLLALVVWALASSRLRARTLAERMTAKMQATSNELVLERQRLENILRGTRVGTWEQDILAGTSQVNDHLLQMLGYTADELPQVSAKTWLEHVHPDDLARSDTELKRHFKGEIEHYECEIRLRHKLGHWIWVLSRGKVFQRDAQGRAEFMAGTYMDITASKEAQENLTRNNAMLQVILESLPCGLSVFDGDLRLLTHNRQFTELFDLPGHLFQGGSTTFESIVRHDALHGGNGQGDVEATVRAVVARARIAAPRQSEQVRADGRVLDIRSAPMPSGGFVTTCTDVSERKRAEEVVRESEHLMRLVTDNISGRIAYWNTALKLKFANKGFFDRHGGNLQDSADRDAAALLGHADFSAVAPAAKAALAGEQQRFEREEQGLAGETTHSLTQMIPDWRNGVVHGVVELTLDISFVKRAETELKNANQALAVERDRARQASVAKGQFLANMSHEIRTPMNAILGMLQLLCNTPLTVRQLDYTHKTQRAARALLNLLNDILDFSKVEAGKMVLDPRPFEVDQMLRDLSAIVSSNLGQKPVEIVFDIDPAMPGQLVGDDMRLQQVLLNLASNALKFTAAGEVIVRARVIERQAARCLIEFAVVDTGIGIAPEHHQHVFSGFSQAEASTTRRFGGTGLGLSICQHLVTLMGGQIRLDSALGEGSTFRFVLALPMVDEAIAAVATMALRALIIDDNPTARTAIAGMAESLGWRADVAASGEEAVAMVARQIEAGTPYQAIFVDWKMPGLDGWQTSLRLRELGGTDAPPLLMMVTAHGHEKLAGQSPENQALLDGYLVKPVTASMLRDAVQEVHGGQAPRSKAPAGKRLAGLRLLVVEDNPNNQQVAQELLEDEGAHITLADDGEKGIAAIEAASPPFDIVLMDIQMPVMDGYTAAVHIRRQLKLAELPIIAMTANAMPADRAACLAAGMNDHVGKPFDLDELVATLLRHHRTGPVAVPVATPRAARALPAALIHAASARGIEIEAAVDRLGGRADIWARTALSFSGQLAGLSAEFDQMLASEALEDAARLMHTLKGLAGMLGVPALTVLAVQAEKALQSGASASVLAARFQARLTDEAAKARTDFDSLLAQYRALTEQPSALPAERDAAGLKARLARLAQLLAESDMAATDCFADLQVAHEAHWPDELQALGEAIAELDFGQALKECDQLARRLDAQP